MSTAVRRFFLALATAALCLRAAEQSPAIMLEPLTTSLTRIQSNSNRAFGLFVERALDTRVSDMLVPTLSAGQATASGENIAARLATPVINTRWNGKTVIIKERALDLLADNPLDTTIEDLEIRGSFQTVLQAIAKSRGIDLMGTEIARLSERVGEVHVSIKAPTRIRDILVSLSENYSLDFVAGVFGKSQIRIPPNFKGIVIGKDGGGISLSVSAIRR